LNTFYAKDLGYGQWCLLRQASVLPLIKFHLSIATL